MSLIEMECRENLITGIAEAAAATRSHFSKQTVCMIPMREIETYTSSLLLQPLRIFQVVLHEVMNEFEHLSFLFVSAWVFVVNEVTVLPAEKLNHLSEPLLILVSLLFLFIVLLLLL